MDHRLKIFVCFIGLRTDHRTDHWIQWTNLSISYMDRIVIRSDRFHYCIIVSTIESAPVDCNHYINC